MSQESVLTLHITIQAEWSELISSGCMGWEQVKLFSHHIYVILDTRHWTLFYNFSLIKAQCQTGRQDWGQPNFYCDVSCLVLKFSLKGSFLTLLSITGNWLPLFYGYFHCFFVFCFLFFIFLADTTFRTSGIDTVNDNPFLSWVLLGGRASA